MDASLACLLLAAFTESYIVYQILIYVPFYISEETHALDSKINLFIALTLSSYPLGLVIGHRSRIYIRCKHGAKKSLSINLIFNIIGLIIMSDTTVFDRSIYHFVIGNFIMGLFGNSWNNILDLASHLLYSSNNNYKHNELYCYISTSHGIGTIFAGLTGAFLNINNGINIQFMDTPFIIAASCCVTTVILAHFTLNIEPETVYNEEQNDNINENVFLWCNKDNITITDALSLLISMDNMLFIVLWIISILILIVIFSFDILFPFYCSISSVNGGMGWNSHFVGLFYTFYTFSWMFMLFYRYWKLNSGYSVSTSFSNSSLKILKFNCLSLILIFGVIFPFCINSASIHHIEWSPISWLFLGFVLSLTLGVISASTSYHIAQSFYDLILNERDDINDCVHAIFIILSNSLMYIRVILPLLIQFLFVIGIHLNNTMISNHLHSKREWYQIGNIVFYVLSIMSLIAFLLLIVYDKKRREKYGEEIEREEMNRLIKELRQQQNTEMNKRIIIEDYHGLGFWISINLKSITPSALQYTLCCPNQQ